MREEYCSCSLCFDFLSLLQVKCDVDLENAPWGPEYEHEIEMEFTPMDPRDFPGNTHNINTNIFHKEETKNDYFFLNPSLGIEIKYSINFQSPEIQNYMMKM